MKKLITFLVGAMCASACMAQDMVTLTVASASTNAAAVAADTATQSGKSMGWIDCVDIDLTSDWAAPTCTVSLTTQGTGDSRPAQTIFAGTITTDTGPKYIRVKPVTTGNVACGTNVNRIALFSDRLVFKAYAKTATNKTIAAKCTVILSDVP